MVRAKQIEGRVNALAQRIAALIAAHGPISVADYMTIALHDPRSGYYVSQNPFGASGDYVTAPEISQIFGELLGLWCVQVWRGQGGPKPMRLVELGPGRGTLMADILRASRAAPEFLEELEVVLVEASPRLRDAQRERLDAWSGMVRWAGRLEDALGDGPILLVANEFFDALPIRQYVRTSRGWNERMVALDASGSLTFALAPQPATPTRKVPEAPEGAVLEISAAASAICHEIGRCVARRGGGALIVDYGYDKPGGGETLQALERHAFASVLERPGERDLSAHVDFSSLIASATEAGAKTYGPIPQGRFLSDLGIGRRLEQLMAGHPEHGHAIGSQVNRLIDPAQMGDLFKALAILPPTAPKPPGF